jgi:hypothetical protein
MEQVLDTPAHPLFVHAPVVLMPLMTIAMLVVGVVPRWRRQYAWPLLIGAAVLLVATMLAVQSGEALDEAFDGAVPTQEHKRLAETTRLFVLGFFLATAATVAVTLLGGRRRGDDAAPSGAPLSSTAGASLLPTALAVLSLVLGVLGCVWMARTGHEGASITWCPGGDGVLCGDTESGGG